MSLTPETNFRSVTKDLFYKWSNLIFFCQTTPLIWLWLHPPSKPPNHPAGKVSEKRYRAIYAKQKLLVFISYAENCFWTQPKPLNPKTCYKSTAKNYQPESRRKLAWFNVQCSIQTIQMTQLNMSKLLINLTQLWLSLAQLSPSLSSSLLEFVLFFRIFVWWRHFHHFTYPLDIFPIIKIIK